MSDIAQTATTVAVKKIGVIRKFFVWIGAKILAFFQFIGHLFTDNKGQGDIRAVLGIACYSVAIAIGFSLIPSLVHGVAIDLASVGTILGIFITAGTALFGIAKDSLQ